jgi:hypothetical protein
MTHHPRHRFGLYLQHCFRYIVRYTSQECPLTRPTRTSPRQTREERQQKVRENRLRRVAERRGLILQKSRRRDHRALDYGQFWLIDARQNFLVFPSGDGAEVGASLDEVEEWLNG